MPDPSSPPGAAAHRAASIVSPAPASGVLLASELAWAWERCPRCRYRRVRQSLWPPRDTVSPLYGLVGRGMRARYDGARTETLARGMPAGVLHGAERRLVSQPILSPSGALAVTLRGRVDAVVACDDGTVTLVGLRVSMAGPAGLRHAGRPLHGYAFCWEHPAERGGEGSVRPVSALGLLLFRPQRYTDRGDGTAAVEGPVGWVEFPLDRESFPHFLAQVLSVLERPYPPPPARGCDLCRYRTESRRKGG